MPDGLIFETIVAPTDGTTGENLILMLTALTVDQEFDGAVVDDVECNVNRDWVHSQPLWATIEEIMTYARPVTQFDWLTLFFFVKRPPDEVVSAQFNDRFRQSVIVVRAVDGTFFYLYAPHKQYSLAIGNMLHATTRCVHADAIDHPF